MWRPQIEIRNRNRLSNARAGFADDPRGQPYPIVRQGATHRGNGRAGVGGDHTGLDDARRGRCPAAAAGGDASAPGGKHLGSIGRRERRRGPKSRTSHRVRRPGLAVLLSCSSHDAVRLLQPDHTGNSHTSIIRTMGPSGARCKFSSEIGAVLEIAGGRRMEHRGAEENVVHGVHALDHGMIPHDRLTSLNQSKSFYFCPATVSGPRLLRKHWARLRELVGWFSRGS